MCLPFILTVTAIHTLCIYCTDGCIKTVDVHVHVLLNIVTTKTTNCDFLAEEALFKHQLDYNTLVVLYRHAASILLQVVSSEIIPGLPICYTSLLLTFI